MNVDKILSDILMKILLLIFTRRSFSRRKDVVERTRLSQKVFHVSGLQEAFRFNFVQRLSWWRNILQVRFKLIKFMRQKEGNSSLWYE